MIHSDPPIGAIALAMKFQCAAGKSKSFNRHREHDVSVFASCGHEVFSGNDLIPVEYDDEEIDHDQGCFVPVIVTGYYCPKCAAEGKADGRYRTPKHC